MRIFFVLIAILMPCGAFAAPVGYVLRVVTAYATADPFPNRIGSAVAGPDTGYLEISNTGSSVFTGLVGTTAVSPLAGDLSFLAGDVVLAPGDSISIAVPDDASNVGGFNGPAFQARPGVEIWLRGAISSGNETELVGLSVADAGIHSGVMRVDPLGLASDSFVLQGGDPWGFDTGDAFELTQARGTFFFMQAAPEPAGLALFLLPFGFLIALRRRP